MFTGLSPILNDWLEHLLELSTLIVENWFFFFNLSTFFEIGFTNIKSLMFSSKLTFG